MNLSGYARADGRKGIRNVVVVAYLVECAHHVAREIVAPFATDVHLIGFPGCYPNPYARRCSSSCARIPTWARRSSCRSAARASTSARSRKTIAASGRPVHTLGIQDTGGTRKTIAAGREWVEQALIAAAGAADACRCALDELVVGTICGGSDATSGLTANPAMGVAFDLLVADGASDLRGDRRAHRHGAPHGRARHHPLGDDEATVAKAATYYATLGYASFAPGNADGGLTTIEEKSLGAYAKSGQSRIYGIVKPGIEPPAGLYLLDVVPDGEVRFGFPNINDNAEIAELIACGSHVILFSTGRGSVVGSAISPVIKVCANPDTYRRMRTTWTSTPAASSKAARRSPKSAAKSTT